MSLDLEKNKPVSGCPNLFDFATSELSQDAFLCWLISWADSKYQQEDPFLHGCATSFVQNLLDEKNDFIVNSVNVKRQWKKIDLLVEVNDKYGIVIEDKTGTIQHSNQLGRYKDEATKYYSNKNIKVVYIYFKMLPQGNYQTVKESSYRIFQREEMLGILSEYISLTPLNLQNNILVDYYQKLMLLDRKLNAYLSTPIDSKWNGYAWQGFYNHLKEELVFPDSNWGYVANPSGGFWGFWWHWQKSDIGDDEFKYYLQIEQENLVFKLHCPNESSRRNVRSIYREILFKKAKELGIEISKYGRLGAYMGVAILGGGKKDQETYRGNYRKFQKYGDSEILDFTGTIATLKNMEELLTQVKQEIEKKYGEKDTAEAQ